MVERVLQPQATVYEIPNHIEPEPADGAPPAPVRLSHDGAPVIGCVGEFRRVIGLDWLLAAFARVAAEMPCRLALIGPVRDTEALYYTPLIDRHPFVQRILRVGPVEHAQIPAYLNACDLLVFPSVSDGSPNKVLEAMRAARPIIAAPVGGILEMIRHEREGLLVDPRATDDLAAAITRLMRNPEDARALGQAARERAVIHFTAARELAAWQACYRAVLGKGEPARG
ncbi:MAG: glycosyltransferase family 4 protein [Caldilineaceae bacterium]